MNGLSLSASPKGLTITLDVSPLAPVASSSLAQLRSPAPAHLSMEVQPHIPTHPVGRQWPRSCGRQGLHVNPFRLCGDTQEGSRILFLVSLLNENILPSSFPPLKWYPLTIPIIFPLSEEWGTLWERGFLQVQADPKHGIHSKALAHHTQLSRQRGPGHKELRVPHLRIHSLNSVPQLLSGSSSPPEMPSLLSACLSYLSVRPIIFIYLFLILRFYLLFPFW